MDRYCPIQFEADIKEKPRKAGNLYASKPRQLFTGSRLADNDVRTRSDSLRDHEGAGCKAALRPVPSHIGILSRDKSYRSGDGPACDVTHG